MRKLMLLGGMRYLIPVIKKAQELGVYVITCDYLPDNIAHKYSNQYVNVSILDKEKVLEEARKLKIDGIMSFACDPGVVTAAYVAEKMHLPHSGSYEAISILQNKGKFRKFLEENGFNVPVNKSYKNVNDALGDIDLFNWPVIVKPTDSAGSKGVEKVSNPNDLKKSILNALKYSPTKEFIIEDFLEKKGHSSDCDSFSINGKMAYITFSSQRFDDKCKNPYTPSAYSWPSSISLTHQEELKKEIQRLISLLDLKTSIYNIETRECTNGKAYIMECSPRGGGNRLAEMVRYMTGIDMIENSIRASLNMSISPIIKKEIEGHWAEIILHSTTDGIFDHLWISDELKKSLVEEDLWIIKGEHVGGFTGANEAIGTLVLKFEKEEELEEVLKNQDKFFKVILKKE